MRVAEIAVRTAASSRADANLGEAGVHSSVFHSRPGVWSPFEVSLWKKG